MKNYFRQIGFSIWYLCVEIKNRNWSECRYWRWYIFDKFVQPFREIWYGLCNVYYYFSVIWKDRDWDYEYFLILMRRKLSKMNYNFSKFDVHDNSTKYADKIKECVDLLDKMIEDDYNDHNDMLKDYDILFNNLNKNLRKWWY